MSTTGSGTASAVATVSSGGTEAGYFIGPVGPETPAYGCVWLNTLTGQLLYWNGFGWVARQ